MTELQIGLAITAAIVVLAMFLYNKWQGRVKTKKEILDQQRRTQTDDIQLINPAEATEQTVQLDSGGIAKNFSGLDSSLSSSVPINEKTVTSFKVNLKGKNIISKAPDQKIEPSSEQTIQFTNAQALTTANQAKETTPAATNSSFEDVFDILSNNVTPSAAQLSSNNISQETEKTIETSNLATTTSKNTWSPQRKHPSNHNKISQEAKLHQSIDFIIDLEFPQLIAVEDVFQFCLVSQYRFEKPVLMTGWNNLSLSWDWCKLGSNESYTRLQLAQQIVNRQGAVTELELNNFVALANNLSEHFKCKISLPNLQQYLQQAKSLDAFCAELDKQIAISVQCEKGLDFPGTKIRGMAEAAGMILRNGSFVRFSSDEARIIFVVHPQPFVALTPEILRMSNFTGMTFVMDVTHIHPGLEEFEQMLRIINSFATTLKGTIADDSGQALSLEILNNLRDTYLLQTQNKLQQTAIAPGSSLALRLFS